jgi:hypothetical protein
VARGLGVLHGGGLAVQHHGAAVAPQPRAAATLLLLLPLLPLLLPLLLHPLLLANPARVARRRRGRGGGDGGGGGRRRERRAGRHKALVVELDLRGRGDRREPSAAQLITGVAAARAPPLPRARARKASCGPASRGAYSLLAPSGGRGQARARAPGCAWRR